MIEPIVTPFEISCDAVQFDSILHMRSAHIPFRFHFAELASRLAHFGKSRVGRVTISLPFVSFGVSPKSREKQIAREIVIRLKDRRVLSACECCDDCIDKALSSLQEIRRLLVDKQVELSDLRDGPLYLLLEMMALGLRQFLTFEERLQSAARHDSSSLRDACRTPETRQAYFDGLEILRGHLSRCLAQVAALAGMELPKDRLVANYAGGWQNEAYEPIDLIDQSARNPGEANHST